jgi:hypothetical protein
MAGSMKDALRKSGLAPEAPAKVPPAKTFREELPDDETLPPLFDAPALTVPKSDPPRPRKP